MSFGIEFWFWLKYFRVLQFKQSFKPSLKVLYLGEDELIENYLENNHLIVSDNLIGDFTQIKTLIQKKGIDTIVFDNATISNKQIIAHFQELKNENVIFKIIPRKTNFLIGSENSSDSGQIELIETS